MKKAYLTTFIIFLAFISKAQDVSFAWAKYLVGSHFSSTMSVINDAQGNVYTIGHFRGTIDFDPGPNVNTLTADTSSDIFILKLDAGGNFVWVKHIKGTSSLVAWNATNDSNGNIFITGIFQNTTDFDPGNGVYNLNVATAGVSNVFILKLTSNGDFEWAKKLGHVAAGTVNSRDIGTDNNGNVYVAGTWSGTLDFDPGPGIYNLTHIGGSGTDDIYVLKLNPNGDFVWAKQMKGSSSKFVRSIDVDIKGGVYLTGDYGGTIDFDPGAGVYNLSAVGHSSIFVQKIDTDGNFQWAKSMGGTSGDVGLSLASDVDQNLYVTGLFSGTVDFNPGGIPQNLTSNGLLGTFIQKFDVNGNSVWVKQIEKSTGYAIDTDLSGNVYTIGYFRGSVDIDPGPGIHHLNAVTGTGDPHTFIQKLDTNGEFLWAKHLQTQPIISGSPFHIDKHQNIYLIGQFTGTVDFDPGAGVHQLTSSHYYDVFVQKLAPCTIKSVDTKVACSPLTWIDGNTYTVSNKTATHTLIGGAANGCDSTITLNLTINTPPGIGTDKQIACGAFTWIDGNTYTSNNKTATHTLIGGAANGCDSTVTLNLIINAPPGIGTDTQIACGAFTWIDGKTYTSNNNTATHTLVGGAANGCDSTITLNLTIKALPAQGVDTQTACNVFTWIDGNTYTASNNTATHTIIGGTVNGCDSIITLNLTIHQVSDVSTSVTGITIKANNSNATYQWLDCDNNYSPIAGAINQTFTATKNGNYAVQLTENGCADTTTCVNIKIKGFPALVYPNPTSGPITIIFSSELPEVKITLYDVLARAISSSVYQNTNIIRLTINQSSGVYLISIRTPYKEELIPIVKI